MTTTSIYKVGPVKETESLKPDSPMMYGFDCVGALGRPLFRVCYDTREEAEFHRATALKMIEEAKLIVTNPVR